MNSCKYCGVASLNRKGQKYCNVNCMTLDYKKTQKLRNCLNCRSQYNTAPSQNKNYCSVKCYGISRQGQKRPGHSAVMTGKKMPLRILTMEHRAKLSGPNSPKWKGGVTELSNKIRSMNEYFNWKIAVYKRDKYTCLDCGSNKKGMECHHVKLLSLIIKENNIKTLQDAAICSELWNIDNGQTLCKGCHKKAHQIIKNDNN